jgi:hypothetical protein
MFNTGRSNQYPPGQYTEADILTIDLLRLEQWWEIQRFPPENSGREPVKEST